MKYSEFSSAIFLILFFSISERIWSLKNPSLSSLHCRMQTTWLVALLQQKDFVITEKNPKKEIQTALKINHKAEASIDSGLENGESSHEWTSDQIRPEANQWHVSNHFHVPKVPHIQDSVRWRQNERGWVGDHQKVASPPSHGA